MVHLGRLVVAAAARAAGVPGRRAGQGQLRRGVDVADRCGETADGQVRAGWSGSPARSAGRSWSGGQGINISNRGDIYAEEEEREEAREWSGMRKKGPKMEWHHGSDTANVGMCALE